MELKKTGGGKKVYPGEVEAVLLKHLNIQAYCVVEVPDSTWGESLIAVCN